MKSHVPVPVPNKVWNATFISVLIANMATNLGQFMMNTLIPKYANAMGASATMVGFVSSSFAVTALLLKVFAAPMIDTFNKKYLTFGSVLVIMTAFLGYSVSTNVTMMICFRLLHGAGMAFSTISFLAIAGSALPPDKIGTGIGYFSLGQAAIQAIAPTVGLELAGAIGYNRAFLVGGAIMAASSLLVLNIRGQKSSGRKLRISLKSVVAVESLPAAILLFFLAMAYCTISSFLVIYADTRQVENIGLFFTVNAITLLASRPLVGRLMDKYGFRAVGFTGSVLLRSGHVCHQHGHGTVDVPGGGLYLRLRLRGLPARHAGAGYQVGAGIPAGLRLRHQLLWYGSGLPVRALRGRVHCGQHQPGKGQSGGLQRHVPVYDDPHRHRRGAVADGAAQIHCTHRAGRG